MKAVEFCYWLQGLFEVGEPTELNAKQTDIIKRHLNMVFHHEIDPSYPAEQQDALNNLHSNSTKPAINNSPIPVKDGYDTESINDHKHKKNFMGMSPSEYEAAGRPRC